MEYHTEIIPFLEKNGFFKYYQLNDNIGYMQSFNSIKIELRPNNKNIYLFNQGNFEEFTFENFIKFYQTFSK